LTIPSYHTIYPSNAAVHRAFHQILLSIPGRACTYCGGYLGHLLSCVIVLPMFVFMCVSCIAVCCRACLQ